MVLREGALARRRGHHRDARSLGEGDQRRVRLGDAHAVAGDDHRPLRRCDRLCGQADPLGIHRRREVRQVVRGAIELGFGGRLHVAGEPTRRVKHRHRPGLARHRVLHRELRGLHARRGFVGGEHLLGHATEGLARIPHAVVAGAGLVGAVQVVARAVAEVGQQQHRRAGEQRLHRAEQAVAEHPRPLADDHARLAREPPVHLGHHAREALVAYGDGADLVLVVGERHEQPARVAAGDAEHHVDAGLGQHLQHRIGGARLLADQWFGCHQPALFQPPSIGISAPVT